MVRVKAPARAVRGHSTAIPAHELDDRGEIRERRTERDVGSDILPRGGEVAGNQAQQAEKDGGQAIDVKPEIGWDAAVLHDSSSLFRKRPAASARP